MSSQQISFLLWLVKPWFTHSSHLESTTVKSFFRFWSSKTSVYPQCHCPPPHPLPVHISPILQILHWFPIRSNSKSFFSPTNQTWAFCHISIVLKYIPFVSPGYSHRNRHGELCCLDGRAFTAVTLGNYPQSNELIKCFRRKNTGVPSICMMPSQHQRANDYTTDFLFLLLLLIDPPIIADWTISAWCQLINKTTMQALLPCLPHHV